MGECAEIHMNTIKGLFILIFGRIATVFVQNSLQRLGKEAINAFNSISLLGSIMMKVQYCNTILTLLQYYNFMMGNINIFNNK